MLEHVFSELRPLNWTQTITRDVCMDVLEHLKSEIESIRSARVKETSHPEMLALNGEEMALLKMTNWTLDKLVRSLGSGVPQ